MAPDEHYRDPEPTRRMPNANGQGGIRDPKTGRPTPPQFLRDNGPGDGRTEGPRVDATRVGPPVPPSDAPIGPREPRVVSSSPRPVSSSPRMASTPRPGGPRGGYPDPYEQSFRDGVGPGGLDVRDVDGPRLPPPTARAPRPPARRPPAMARRRRGLRLFRTILVLLLLVLVAYPLSLGVVAWRNVGRTEALPTPPDTAGTTYLLVGSDSRADLTADDVNSLATGSAAEAGGARTDTILLLHVPGGSQPPALISVPRDSYVPIPGQGNNKINAAYALGGAPLLADTINQVTGVGVDSYVETGLGGFARITDAIGGVDMCLPAPLEDPNAGINLPAGCQTLTGPQALGLARSRKTDAQGDLARVERQRAVLSAIVNQAASPGNVLNPLTGYRLAAAGGSALTLDQGTGPLGLGRFVMGMRTVASGGGITLTVPVSNPNLQTDAGSSVEWDAAESQRLWTALQQDDMATVQAIADAQRPAVEAPTEPGAG